MGRIYARVGVITLVLSATFAVAESSATPDPCAAFSRCSECVYDAFVGTSRDPLQCQWCEESMTCSQEATCATPRTDEDSTPQCDDMQCLGARITGNMYWCRPGTIAVVVLTFLLLTITAVYWVWMRAIHQMPWKYPLVLQALDRLSGRETKELLEPSGRTDHHSCPVCHCYTGKVHGPGKVCFWCDVARIAVIPFIVGVCSVGTLLFCLFFLSLRPSFSDWYYALLLIEPSIVYLAFGTWVCLTSRPIHGDPEERPTTFASLAVALRGRSLSSLFDVAPVGPSLNRTSVDGSPSGPLSPHGEATSASMASPETKSTADAGDLHGDTVHTLELDTSIHANFRECLRETIRYDEFIVWHEQPSTSVLLVHNAWLVAVFLIGSLVGVVLLVLAGSSPEGYPEALLSRSVVSIVGVVQLVFNSVMLLAVASSLKRLYVMTNRRLFILSSGLCSSTHMIPTELSNVRSAAVHGNEELGFPMLRFAWGENQKANRKMPLSKMTEFVGVVAIEELLNHFREHCSNIDSEGLKSQTARLRSTWRVHLAVLVAMSMLAPVILISPRLLPEDIAVVAVVLAWAFCLVLARRGWGVLRTTSAHLNVAKEWGRSPGGFSFRRLLPGSALSRRRPQKRAPRPGAATAPVASPALEL